jgi:Protein of unknown function (DUF3305)
VPVAPAAADTIAVAVVIERVAAPNRWEDWQFRLLEVRPDSLGDALGGASGSAADGRPPARMLAQDGARSTWLHAGFTLTLYPDECKGYFLNLTSGNPGWFVSWVADESDASRIQLTGVSVSYIEADRRMFAEERVETLPLQPELCEWLRLYTNAHFKPDGGKRKVRSAAFVDPSERGRLPDDAQRADGDAGEAGGGGV